MKKIILILALFLVAYEAGAQTCKIKIYYDDNGNRIKRVEECTGKPALEEENVVNTLPGTLDKGELNELEATFQVYPNPAEHKVNVKLDANSLAQRCSIILTDITGRTLYQKQKVTEAVSVIDLGGYADGTYYIILLRDKMRNTVKIVKQTGNGYQ